MIVNSIYRSYFELYKTTNIEGSLDALSGKVKADFDVTCFKNGAVFALDYDIREIDPINAPGFYVFEFVPDEATDYYIEFDLYGDPINPDFIIDGRAWNTSIDDLVMEGNRQVTISTLTPGLVPIPDVTVDIYDNSQNLRYTGITPITDINGQVRVSAKDGTYKVRLVKAGFTFTVPETLTVLGNTTVTYTGIGAVTIPAPAVGMQTLVGNVRKLNWAVATGEIIAARIAGNKQFVGGAMIQNDKLDAIVDVDSNFALSVPCNSNIKLIVPHHGEHDISISDVSDVVNISTYL